MNPSNKWKITGSTFALRRYFWFFFFFAMYHLVGHLHNFFHFSMYSITLKAKWFSKGSETTAAKCPSAGRSLNVLDKCAVCKGANLISMVWIFKGITCCNCLTEESINHCSVRSSCNFFANVGIYFPSILFFFSFNLARSFKRLIAAVFKNNKLISHVPTWRLNNYTYQTCPSPFRKGGGGEAVVGHWDEVSRALVTDTPVNNGKHERSGALRSGNERLPCCSGRPGVAHISPHHHRYWIVNTWHV